MEGRGEVEDAAGRIRAAELGDAKIVAQVHWATEQRLSVLVSRRLKYQLKVLLHWRRGWRGKVQRGGLCKSV